MGVDYLARKSAKKDRKRAGKEGKVPRSRSRTGPRRLCRGVCFQEPVLQAADLEEEETGPLAPSASAPPPKHESLESRIATQLTSEPVPAAPRVETPRQAAPKRRKMSTSVALPVRVEHSEAERPLPQAAQGAPTPPSAALAQLPPLFQRYMASKGFAEPTPVQDQTWAPLLAGRDVQAVAEPGAGKTLTFLLPAAALLEKGAAKVPAATATVLVLEPTRELAQQVGLVWKDLAHLTGAQAAVIHGGVPKQEHVRGEGLGGVVFVLGALSETEEDEVAAIKSKPQVVIATPGRLLDLVDSGALSLSSVRYLVLDEADRMLGMGFAPQLDRLRGCLPAAAPPQVSLFTATLPEGVAGVAASWLRDPLCVSAGPSAASISHSVTQVVQILVASDVAARGLHIRNLPYVVNYDFPGNLEQYIHRVGRTGRLATDGHAFSFFTRELAPLAAPLIELLEAHDADLDPNLLLVAKAYAVVKEKLGEAERPRSEDVLGELGLKARKKKGRREADEVAGGQAGQEAHGGEAVAGQGPVEPAAPAPAYIPAKAFKGARQGYVFGNRASGLGYHLDTAAAPVQGKRSSGPPATSRRPVGGAAPGDAEVRVEAAVVKRKKALPGRLRKKLAASAAPAL
ncbi:putative ATP-dependent RNA helicase ddx3 [Auxenochlorella protothecoides]|uniref:Putative ATP-dependent RNA helicase ddx3 n=1 Tax=Auxenochlorella protothecoides TaxID=3075 RepID=A0A087SB45_AUXPR|nr:putative ATP-dependent RNA helicase ddx3 [Auxenochlorella protothecoides]KFM22949.1 putative ATP-dependent RNA helicase ddx3 [Auxenochlorella protothecoides]